jgi:tetrapyrrole methylase family protein/MazG family protein
MPAAEEFIRLLDIMHRLRAECPWDREQTHASLRAYLLEESYEVLHALDEERHDLLREELGDLMLQVVFHAEIAQEDGRFDIADVLHEINEKLVRRHPHVFADAVADDAEAVLRRWSSIKTQQEKKESVLDGVPTQLPANLQAVRVLSKVRQAGLDPMEVRDPLAEARRSLERLAAAVAGEDPAEADRALGMLGLNVVALSSRVHANPEDAVRRAVRRLSEAFRREEARLKAEGCSFGQLSAEELAGIAARVREACQEETGEGAP